MAKEKAAEAKLQDAKAEQEKKTKIKFNDIKRKVMSSVKEETLEESEAIGDVAKSMGLTYIQVSPTVTPYCRFCIGFPSVPISRNSSMS